MVLVIGFVFGLICSLVAGSKQRNPIGWFAIGFFFPVIGLILAIVLPENSPESLVRRNERAAGRPAGGGGGAGRAGR